MTAYAIDTADPAERARRLRGIALTCLALVLFSLLDAVAKYLAAFFLVQQVIFFRFFSHLMLTAAVMPPGKLARSWRTRRPLLQFARAACLVGSTTFNFIAVQYLQLSETVSIMFAAPLIVAALAGPLLGEWIGPRRWAAVVIGFVGVLVVTRPGLGGLPWQAVFSVAAAVAYAFYSIISRMLHAEPTTTALIWGSALGVLVYLPFMPEAWRWPELWLDMALFVSLGVFGATGHALLVTAHRFAPAAVLMPFVYTQILWMTGLGLVVFGDVPDLWTLAGAGIVIGSGLYLLWRERRVKGVSA